MDIKHLISYFNLKLWIVLVFSISIVSVKAQFINVDTNYNAQQLVDKFLGSANSCITVSNVKMSGWDFGSGNTSYGFFDKGTSSFDMKEGIILSSGRARDAVGPNNSLQSANNSSWYGDSDLERAVSINVGSSYNATYLEFDFVSNNSSKIFFDYMFLSEQYLRNIDAGSCDYTDGFAFLIKKQGDANYKNLAVIPGTNTPIKSNTVRGGGERCPAINAEYFGQYNYGNSATNFNGETKILTATTDVIPGQIYHIKLVVADQGNGLYDSAVFLKAGSFVGSKDLGKDLTLENSNALCAGTSYTINATTTDAIKYTWYKDGIQIKSGNFPTQTVSYTDAGTYEVEIELNSGCRLKGQIIIEQQILPIISTSAYSFCDVNLNNEISLTDFTKDIISNYNQYSRVFDVRYFETDPSGITNPGPGVNLQKYPFPLNSKTLYIWVKSGNCPPVITPILFTKNTLSKSNTITPFTICDDLLEGKKIINLNDYVPALITNIQGSVVFYKTLLGAQFQTSSDRIDNTDASKYIISSNNTVYVRFHQAGLCDNVAPLSFVFKHPKKSLVLTDKTICQSATTLLDAGSGFDDYTWGSDNPTSPINGIKTSSINNVPVGNYWVDLTSNTCTYRQYVKVIAAETPKIKSIDITGSTVTVTTEGGSLPYLYALDSGNYQSSNVFSNVTLGLHTIYIKYGDNCGPISMSFSLINPINVITPNNDGINDVIDYSELSNKTEPRLQILDRYGMMLFDSNITKTFIWDGKFNGNPLPTASYWYILNWKEFGVDNPIQKTGWILLKNRN